MRQFRTDQFDNQPPFACCLFHKEIKPQDQNFIQMLRMTLFPNFQLYSFTFFWLITSIFVFIYSLSLAPITDITYINQSQFLKVSQKALFILGQNYPYYLVKKGNYYRLLTSTILFRNLYHFTISSIGLVSFGSYIQQIVGFKRMVLLSISTGVGGELIRNVFVYSATIESLTPLCGLIGFMVGYYVVKSQSKWKYCQRQKIQMLVVMSIMFFLYIQLGIIYPDISWVSMLSGFLLGFVFFFCDPNDQKYQSIRLWAVILLVSAITMGVLLVFLRSNPPLVV